MASVESVLMQGLSSSSSSSSLLSSLLPPPQGQANPFLGGNGTDPFGIIDWIRGQPGGIFNPKQELRLQDGMDRSSRWMLYATDAIEEGEILSKIPWQSILMPQEVEFDPLEDITGDLNCDTTRYLIEQMRLDNTSTFAPYIRYLKALPEGQPQIPSAWSEKGKQVLVELLGGLDPVLPPGEPIQKLDDDWYLNCEGTDEGIVAASLIFQRGLYDTYLVPTLDWYTHRNGNFYNIQTEFENGDYIALKARRPIQAGEPLHNSYDMCDECNEEALESGYGTAGKRRHLCSWFACTTTNLPHSSPILSRDISALEIFRDYGIVEQFPQRWTFHPNAVVLNTDEGSIVYAPEQITFELIQDGTNTDSSNVQVQWSDHLMFDDRGRNYVRRVFRQHLRQLYRFQNIHYDLLEEGNDNDEGNASEQISNPDLPLPMEWKQIKTYYRSLRFALQSAIHSLENQGDETAGQCLEGMSSNEGACESAYIDIYGVHYDDLLEEEDTLNYIFPTCPTTQLLEFSKYETIEDIETNYQKLWFMTREEDKDVCMNLENTLQICSNYRPHYHEFFVHFPARFIENIERVIFIGGGDSMLLHEVLKYPTLNKVVGLELDQQVTRKSFQHFKTQPHWDNDKVEWWYGDATKSLPLLPRDYWGSFDLVLVDLSETVMSFSVTQTMDIFSALSLLLKPEGIMVKNEPYIDQFSDFFDHTIQIFYGKEPVMDVGHWNYFSYYLYITSLTA